MIHRRPKPSSIDGLRGNEQNRRSRVFCRDQMLSPAKTFMTTDSYLHASRFSNRPGHLAPSRPVSRGLPQGIPSGPITVLLCLLGVVLAGCRPEKLADPAPSASHSQESDTSSASSPLRVLVVDDQPLAEAISRQWTAHARETLEMLTVTSDELTKNYPECDVIVYPSSQVGQLVKDRVIVPWPAKWQPLAGSSTPDDSLATYDWDGLFPPLTRHELRWANELYGVSFGSPQWLLFYRADLLREWNLQPPATWLDYQALLEAIQLRLNEPDDEATPTQTATSNGQSASGQVAETGNKTDVSTQQRPRPQFATIEPLSPGWASKVLLARSTAYARHPNQYSTFFHFVTMDALIDQPPYQRAFDELRAAVIHMPPDVWSCDPHESMVRFLKGESVLAWGWPSRARAGDLPTRTDGQENPTWEFGVVPLPGSLQVYQVAEAKWEDREASRGPSVPLLGISGRIGSITRRCRFPDAACNLLLWLTGNEASGQIAAKSRFTTVFRLAHLNQVTSWVEPPLESLAGNYSAVMARNVSSESVMTLRIPGQSRYLAALDEAIRAEQDSGAKSQTSDARLKTVAQKWNAITQELDRERQRQAYAESLGLQAP